MSDHGRESSWDETTTEGDSEETEWGTIRDDPSAVGDDIDDTSNDDDSGIPRPPASWADDDPTGSEWWVWLGWGTALSLVVLVAWPIPVVAWGLLERATDQFVAGPTSVGLVLVFGGVGVVRFVLLPVALFRDASLLRRSDDVPWSPSRAFYMTLGAVAATPICVYYLYKRARYTGNSVIPFGEPTLYFEDRTVQSNWSLVIGGALASGLGAGGFDLLMDGAERYLGDAAIAVVWPILLFLIVLIVCRFVLLPVAFYRDAKAVRRADIGWSPAWPIYAVFGYVFSLPFCLYYLYKRGKHGDKLEEVLHSQ